MDHAAFRPDVETDLGDEDELRRAPRFRLLIRAAKLITAHGEFVCVLRDISSTGVSVKLFHALPDCKTVELELQCGDSYEMVRRWIRGREAGFEFTGSVNIDRLVSEISEFPKRGLRLGIQFPLKVITLAGRCDAFAENLSQQGARIECDSLLAIDQSIRLEGGGLREIRAKVRWRSGSQYGVVFDDTFSLNDLALLAARMQCPQLLAE
ncbi:MAG: hypothetical protein A3J40_12160 [Erythrobacter sp. RIFCSPHIGHO2_12_FULL_63_10]|nr:MAG: hypothetical protein A3J40_12160 [Erythrobacter sp. RIFCSPHIGHO2_12_FULL_63_10]